MRIGKVEWIYVAPINDEFLPGHDMLHYLGAKIDWATEKLIINEKHIQLKTRINNEKPAVARVSL